MQAPQPAINNLEETSETLLLEEEEEEEVYTGPVMYDENKDNLPILAELKSITWEINCENLFHYQSQEIQLKKHRVKKNSDLIRHKNEIYLQEENTLPKGLKPNECEYLGKIVKDPKDPESYSLAVNKEEDKKRKGHAYIIIRSLKKPNYLDNRGIILAPGDIVKFGRLEYKIKQIQVHTKNHLSKTEKQILEGDHLEVFMDNSDNKNENTNHLTWESPLKLKNDPNMTCKYCLLTDIKTENPFENMLINPCNCNGQDMSVHFLCLKEWVKKKMGYKNKINILEGDFSELNCEICKGNLPAKIKLGDETRNLIDIEKPKVPYIQFENIGQCQPTEKFKSLLWKVKPILSIGTNNDSDLQLNDLSIEGVHAKVKYSAKRGFTLFDNDTKFGTLVRLKSDYKIPKLKEAVQIGRTAFTMLTKPDYSLKN